MKIDLINRVEGHGRIELSLKGKHVASVKFDILTPPRLFEKLIVGRHYSDIPTIVSRICSICSASHRIVSIMAIENLFNVKIPKEIKILRNLLLHGEALESHGLHLFILSLPDYYGKKSFVEMAKEMPEIVSIGFKIKGLGNKIQEIVGGRAIHQITPVVGGMTFIPSKKEIISIKQNAESILEEVVDIFKKIPFIRFTPFVKVKNWVSLSGMEYGYTGEYILINNDEKIEIDKFWDRFKESSLPPSYVKHTLLDNKPFMVGAFPRILNGSNKIKGKAFWLMETLYFKDILSTYMNNIAQAIEIVFSLEQVINMVNELLDMKLTQESILVDFKPKAGKAIAAVEAPRGLLIHKYNIDEKGYILNGDIITPTALNLSDMEQNLKIMAETLLKETTDIKPLLETLIRAYDPCISCSVHIFNI